MPGRPRKLRVIRFNPEITYFKPAGIPLKELSEEVLLLDEVEAVRLHDFEGLNQEQAAEEMRVSRVTFLRILHSAHKKIARSLIFGKAIKVKGGDIIMPNYDGTGPRGIGSMSGRRNPGGREQGQGLGGSFNCVCPNCGESVAHAKGNPCSQTKCPKCGTMMRGDFCTS